jgi:phenylalanyl-tRNA synthetase alpha chain
MFDLHQDEILSTLEQCSTSTDIKSFYDQYLSKTGAITWAYKQLGSLTPDERKEAGQLLSSLFKTVESAFDLKQQQINRNEQQSKLSSELVDRSIPPTNLDQGHLTLQTQLRRRIEEIFVSMGFVIHYGNDLVTGYENFTSVNIPPTHPATEMHDTIYSASGDKLLRTHTSALQNQLIKTYWPSYRCLVPGKVYRYEDMDATHDCVFWQVEGIVIDKGISIGHFKSMMEQILQAILETDRVEFRMRPAFFPFVEPGFEIDAKQVINGKEKRMEILGAGMIHPAVLREAGVDPKEYSGFAFGLGMTRLVAVKHQLHDVRLLTNGDLHFAHSF